MSEPLIERVTTRSMRRQGPIAPPEPPKKRPKNQNSHQVDTECKAGADPPQPATVNEVNASEQHAPAEAPRAKQAPRRTPAAKARGKKGSSNKQAVQDNGSHDAAGPADTVVSTLDTGGQKRRRTNPAAASTPAVPHPPPPAEPEPGGKPGVMCATNVITAPSSQLCSDTTTLPSLPTSIVQLGDGGLIPTAATETAESTKGTMIGTASARLLSSPLPAGRPDGGLMSCGDTTGLTTTGSPQATDPAAASGSGSASYGSAAAAQASPTAAYVSAISQPGGSATTDSVCVDIGGGGGGAATTVPSSGMALYQWLMAEDGEGTPAAGQQRQQQQRQAVGVGSRVWIKMAGYCHWPGVVISLRHCRKAEVPDLLASYQAGRKLVHFYGSHDHVWASPASVTAWTVDRDVRIAALRAAAKSTKVAALTLAELTGSLGAQAASDPAREVARVMSLRNAAMGGKGASGGGGSGGGAGGRKGKQQCGGCGEGGTQVTCVSCRTAFHTLCLPDPEVSPAHMLAAALEALRAQPREQQQQQQPLPEAPQPPPPYQMTQSALPLPQLLLQPQPRSGPPPPPQPLVLRAVWTCGSCGRQNEVKGPVPVNLTPRSGAASPAGANAARDGRRSTREGGAAAGGSARSGNGATDTDPTASQAGRQSSQQQPVGQPDAAHPQHPNSRAAHHAELLALYEYLLAENAALEAGAAVAAAAAAAAGAGLQTAAAAFSSAHAGQGGASFTGSLHPLADGAARMSAPPPRPLPGTRIWVKTPGYCPWPAIVFSVRYCRKGEIPDLLATYQPGHTLIHFYGEHNHTWLPDEDVAELAVAAADPREEEARREGLLAWSSRRKKGAASGYATLAELDSDPTATATTAAAAATTPSEGVAAETVAEDGSAGSGTVTSPDEGTCTPTPGAAGCEGPAGSTCQPKPQAPQPPRDPTREVRRVVALREARLAAEEERREQEAWEMLLLGAREGGGGAGSGRDRDKTSATAGLSGEAVAAAAAGAGAAGGSGGVGRGGDMEAGMGGWRARLRVCAVCEEPGGQVCCPRCRRAYHTLCLTPRWLSPAYTPPGQRWRCSNCGNENEAPQHAGGSHGDGGGASEEERMGLTPDWIIMAGAFKVFQLPRPTAAAPYIRGLLDPCTNSKMNPNIPAEKLYDKEDDGLRLSNSWAGYYVILNPEYTSQTQWRFVNRAIDEVENGSVPAVLLLCRNSTDTAYFQRLRPYPRVMLRRTSARFKDYDKTPIGFGIAVFCIAPRGPSRTHLYKRFIDAFGDWGEPNIPIDSAFMDSPAFSELLDRLADHATRHMRDTWVQCSACRKWRIVPYEVYRRLDEQLSHQQRQRDRPSGSEVGEEGPQESASEGGEGAARQPAGTWTCAQLGAGSGCDRPQSRVEAAGVHYARQRGSQSQAHSQRTGQRGGAPEPLPVGVLPWPPHLPSHEPCAPGDLPAAAPDAGGTVPFAGDGSQGAPLLPSGMGPASGQVMEAIVPAAAASQPEFIAGGTDSIGTRAEAPGLEGLPAAAASVTETGD